MDLRIRHLRVVDAISTAGSITRAAAVLGLTQPALSTQLHRIEQLVGAPIFERGRHGAQPTVLGRMLIEHTRDLLASVDALQRDVAEFQRERGS